MTDRERGGPDDEDSLRSLLEPEPPRAESDGAAGGVKPGDVFAKKYRVERVLGEGGMGVIVLAHHLQLDEKVALKFLLPKAMTRADAVGRFAREARAAAKIKSEHVARVVDVGELENGAPYIVMEYLEGSDLSALLAERGRFPPDQAVGFVLQACEALAEAHALGIVHRDLKPANLFLAKRPGGPPIIKVLDFGISKSTVATGEVQLTKTAALVGSPLYMSPEQMQSSKTVDMRSDIWAIGVVLYELLAGRAPFSSDTMPELVVAILQSEPKPLRLLRPDLPAGIEEVVHRCLAKEPGGRYASVAELAVALEPFGPPRSDVSVERISQVLADSKLREYSQVVVPSGTGETFVSPVALTDMEGVAPTVRDGSQSHPPGRVTAGASTTAKPISSERATLPVPGAEGRRPWLLYAVALVAVLGIGAVLAWPVGRTAVAPLTASPPEPSPPATTTPPPIATLAPTIAPPIATALLDATAPDPHPAPSRTTEPRASAASPRASANRGPGVPVSATSKPDCNPPYTIDPDGIKHYKHECTN